MTRGRIFTACRLLNHWSLGAVIGVVMATNSYNRYAFAFTCLYLITQSVGAIVKPKEGPR